MCVLLFYFLSPPISLVECTLKYFGKKKKKMSIDHSDIEEVLAAHAGQYVRFTYGPIDRPITSDAAIPDVYDGMVTNVATNTNQPLPARRTRYTSVIIINSNDVILAELKPERSASSERAALAEMLATAARERDEHAKMAEQQRLAMLAATDKAAADAAAQRDSHAAQAEQQRLRMLQDAAQAATDAKREREVMAAEQRKRDDDASKERRHLMQLLQNMSQSISPQAAQPSQQLFATPQPASGTSQNPIHLSSAGASSTTSSVVVLPPDLVALMKRREEDDSKVFTSWAPRAEHFSSPQIDTLRTHLPEYRWLKTEKNATQLRQALRAVADNFAACRHLPHDQHLAEIVKTLRTAGATVTPAHAAELQAMIGIASTATGPVDWPRIIIAETIVLATRALPPFIMERLRTARATLPDDQTSGTGVLANLPIARNKKDDKKDTSEQPKSRTCRDCKKTFYGPWTAESCKAGHPKPKHLN